MLYVRLSALKFVELHAQGVEDAPDRCVIGKHHATDFVRRCYVGALLGKSDLDRGRTPGDKLGQFPLTDALERLVHLSWVHITLDDVQDRDVGSLFDVGVDKDVLCVEESAHHIKDCRLADRVDSCVER